MKKAAAMIQIKRVYESVSAADGRRYLVDRLWPRGVSKTRAQLAGWLKDLAPSPGLRRWFHEDKSRFALFKQKYTQELAQDPDKQQLVQQVMAAAGKGPVTLVYAAKDPQRNHAMVLLEFIRSFDDSGVNNRRDKP
jgi:uncharacterized protein YeaO (DUF488 family)